MEVSSVVEFGSLSKQVEVKMLGEALQGEEADVFLRLWHQAMAEVDFIARKLASATCRIEEEVVQEKSKQSGVSMQEKQVSIEVGEVVKVLGKAAQMKLMASKLLKEEVGEFIIKANPEAGEEFNKCDNSFPHEPGADSEQSKSKVKDMTSSWLSEKSNMKAKVAEAPTSSKKVQTKSSNPEKKVEKKVLYTVEQWQLLAEVESWGEEDAEPGLHVELLPASKELMAEVEAWGHEDDAEADISEPSCASKQEAEAEIITQALEKKHCLARKPASSACCNEEELVQEKKEQDKKVPLMIEKQDLIGMSLSTQVEGVSDMKAEAETMVDRMHSTLEEEQRLKEEEVTGVEKDWHELSPLVADKLLPPDREGSAAGALTSGGNDHSLEIKRVQLDKVEMDWCGEVPLLIDKLESVSLSKQGEELKQALRPDVLQGEGSEVTDMKAEARTKMDKMQHAQEQNVQVKQRLMMEEIKTEVEKNWQGTFSLVHDKQNLVEVSVSKKLKKTRLMHALKAEAVQVEECEEEKHEAPQLLVDKQSAAAG